MLCERPRSIGCNLRIFLTGVLDQGSNVFVSRGRIFEAICSDNNTVDANKENKSIAIAINEGARRRSRSNKSKRSTKECRGLQGKKERWEGGWGWGDVYIIEFVCLMISSREAGTFGSLYTK
jgi:hypothetical protein